jgi:hypothetical protein
MRYRPLEARPLPAGYGVVECDTNRLLAGIGNNAHRAWIFPLNTPLGRNTVQEYPFDHPFHNGVFVGQGKVQQGGQESNFWAPLTDWRQPANPVFQRIGLLKYAGPPAVESIEDGMRFSYQTTWQDERERPVLEERRSFEIRAAEDATFCDVTSQKRAAYGDLTFAVTKHGAIGARVQPQLLPVLSGEIQGGRRDRGVRRGLAEEVAHLQSCDFVGYEAEVPGLGRFGVCLIIRENTASPERQGPWFIRDYGMALFNPTLTAPVHLAEGDSWSVGLRVVAYDGSLDLARAEPWLVST